MKTFEQLYLEKVGQELFYERRAAIIENAFFNELHCTGPDSERSVMSIFDAGPVRGDDCGCEVCRVYNADWSDEDTDCAFDQSPAHSPAVQTVASGTYAEPEIHGLTGTRMMDRSDFREFARSGGYVFANEVGCLDAPDESPAGSMRDCSNEIGPLHMKRLAWREL